MKKAISRTSLVVVCIALLVSGISCANDVPDIDGATLFNFHIVEDGQFYRSAQPTPDALANVLGQLGIRTILNLRGENEGESWYDQEREIADMMGVTLEDQPMSSQSLPSGERLAEILDILENGQYPILVHCQGGADRTGAISAIYRMHILGHDRTDALTELSPLTLHFRAYAPCMDLLAEIFESTPEWLQKYAQTYTQLTCQP